MLETLIRIVLIVAFVIILIQDLKSRTVTWFLFPLVTICSTVLFFINSFSDVFYTSILYNLFFVLILFTSIYIYSKLKLKTTFNNVIGAGDILLFIGMCFAFSTVSFIVLFICSLFFSLILHLFVSKKQTYKTVPLAGYMSLFFCVVFLGYWLGIIDNVYQI